MTKPKVAIIGLEASGKTVLMTVLAKKLSQTVHKGYFLDPKGTSTIKYIEGVWSTLQHGDWPPSTPPGEMFNLRWSMRITPDFSGDGQSYEADVHLVDAAGQDMRQLFGVDNPEDIPSYLRPLAEYCTQADILLIALNIKDYVGESDPVRIIENQATIKAALDMLQKSNHHVAILFTQMDQYQSYIDQSGGLENFCKEKLPYIYNSYVANSANSLISVAAVNDTEIVEKEDGLMVRVPKQNFSSTGLENVCDWLAQQVVAMSNREASDKKIENQRLEVLIEAEDKRIKAEKAKTTALENEIKQLKNKSSNSGCWGALIILLIVGGVIAYNGESLINTVKKEIDNSGITKEFIPDPPPRILKKEAARLCNTGVFDCWSHNASVNGTVFNPGRPGSFKVIATIYYNGRTEETQSEIVSLGNEESTEVQFYFSDLSFCANRCQWTYDVQAERIE